MAGVDFSVAVRLLSNDRLGIPGAEPTCSASTGFMHL